MCAKWVRLNPTKSTQFVEKVGVVRRNKAFFRQNADRRILTSETHHFTRCRYILHAVCTKSKKIETHFVFCIRCTHPPRLIADYTFPKYSQYVPRWLLVFLQRFRRLSVALCVLLPFVAVDAAAALVIPEVGAPSSCLSEPITWNSAESKRNRRLCRGMHWLSLVVLV